jgi:hypothetical protein
MGLLDGDIKAIIGTATDFLMGNITLRRVTATSFDPIAATYSSPTNNDHACRGYVDSYNLHDRATGLINDSDLKVIITQTSLDTAPIVGDLVIVKSRTYKVARVDQDAAGALWTLQARA